MASMGQVAKWGSFETLTQKPEVEDSFGILLDLQRHGKRPKHYFSRDCEPTGRSTLPPKKLI